MALPTRWRLVGRPEALSVPTSPAPSSSDAATGKTDAGDCDSAGSGGGGGVAKGDTTGGGSGGSSLLEDLMGGLSLPVFASNPSVDGSQRSQTEPDLVSGQVCSVMMS